MSNELSSYIQQARSVGIGDEEIRSLLLQAGWQPLQIDEYLPHAPAHKQSGSKKFILVAISLVLACLTGIAAFVFYFTSEKPQSAQNEINSDPIATVTEVTPTTTPTEVSEDPYGLAIYQLLPDEIPSGYRLMTMDDPMAAQLAARDGMTETPGYITDISDFEYTFHSEKPDKQKIKHAYLSTYIGVNTDVVVLVAIQYTSQDALKDELKKIVTLPGDELVFLFKDDVLVMEGVFTENDTASAIRDSLASKLEERFHLERYLTPTDYLSKPEVINGVSLVTFTNDTFGYSFKYPSNWKMDNPTPSSDKTFASVFPLSYGLIAFSVRADLQKEYPTLSALKAVLVKEGYTLSEEKRTIGGKSLNVISTKSPHPGFAPENPEEIYFFYDGIGYTISVSHEVKDTDIALSTFRFLD